MALLCRMGLHNWQGCRCSRCGQTRESGHDWMKNCELCARCGRKRSGAHQWINHIGVRCSHCGMTASNVLNPAGSAGRGPYCLFPPGERVYLVNCNDRWNLEAAGRLYENIWMRGGQTGTVLGYHAGGAVVVRWDEQAWEQEHDRLEYEARTAWQGRRGRIDIQINERDGSVSIIELKATQWDRISPGRIRLTALRHARQVWRFVNDQVLRSLNLSTKT